MGVSVFVFFIILFVIFLIKIFIQFPGLLEWRFVFSDDESVSDDEDVERNDIIKEITAHPYPQTGCKKSTKMKAVATVTEERKNDEDVEIFPQTTADRHALLSNFMAS